MCPRTRRLFTAVARRFTCAVIHGRSRSDLARRCAGVQVSCLVGNHGDEGPWLRRGAAVRRRVARWALTLGERLSRLTEIDIEDKGLSLAIHYRRALSPGRREKPSAAWRLCPARGSRAAAGLRRGPRRGSAQGPGRELAAPLARLPGRDPRRGRRNRRGRVRAGRALAGGGAGGSQPLLRRLTLARSGRRGRPPPSPARRTSAPRPAFGRAGPLARRRAGPIAASPSAVLTPSEPSGPPQPGTGRGPARLGGPRLRPARFGLESLVRRLKLHRSHEAWRRPQWPGCPCRPWRRPRIHARVCGP
jgi:hypothetical protein